MRIGIFGGAFNPVHNGHLNLAENYYNDLKLDKLIIIPTANPPHKSGEYLVSKDDRLNMLRLAVKDMPYEISTIEFERTEKSYTYDTLCILKEKYPGAEFFLIIGSDQFLTFNYWYNYSKIIDMVTLCTMARDNEPQKAEIKLFAEKLGLDENSFYLLNKPILKISSSDIRNRIKNNTSITGLVTDEVENYILEKGLYRV